jgi:SAM-dependent methyltransferase
MNIWDKIYEKGEWGKGSGSGSTVETTKKYVEVVNEYLDRDHFGTCRVLDIGCGMWGEWQTKLNLYNQKRGGGNQYFYYVGIDPCESVTRHNRTNYLRDESVGETEFFECSAVKHLESMGEYDLSHNRSRYDIVLIKDVFQHISFESIQEILLGITKIGTAIITNDSVLDGVNRDCEDGGYRPIDLRLPPFNLKPTRVVDYPSRPHQKTILIFEK